MKRLSWCLVATVVLIVGCASQGYRLGADEEIYDTWANPDYTASPENLTFNYQPGGVLEVDNPNAAASMGLSAGEYSVQAKWMDSDGNPIYRLTWGSYLDSGGERLRVREYEQLVKVNPSQGTMETVMIRLWTPNRSEHYPELEDVRVVDPNHKTYRILYRQE